MTAKDDCNMIALIILNIFATPIAILAIAVYVPYTLSGSMDTTGFTQIMTIIGLGTGLCFLAGLLIGVGQLIDDGFNI